MSTGLKFRQPYYPENAFENFDFVWKLPDGAVINTAPGSLPGCIGSDTLVTSCNRVFYDGYSYDNMVFNNWFYYDFPPTCNNDLTLFEGPSSFLDEGCDNLYPASIIRSAAPTIKIDDTDCQDYIIQALDANTCSCSPVAVAWTATAQDDCNNNTRWIETSKISGSTFDLGTTPVTVMYKYISNGGYILSTCTFNVIVSDIAVPAGIDITTTIDGEDF